MNFSQLCDLFESIRNVKSHQEKIAHLKLFFKNCRSSSSDLFPIVRLIVPKLDRDRPAFRMKETKISKLIINMLGLPPGNDKNLVEHAAKGSNIEFSDVVYTILKKYLANKENGMTVDEMNANLDKIALRASDSGLDDLILQIFRKLSPNNIRWLIQLLLKDLKLKLGDNAILAAFHEDAVNFYNSNNNLKKLCEVLAQAHVKLHEIELVIFEAFRPMLSKRCDAKNFRKNFPLEKSFIIENKFDGERFQLHMNNKIFKYYSRNGFDFTPFFGGNFENGVLTPLLKNVFDSNTKKLILDGEMMLWNKRTKHFGSKGMNLDVKKLTHRNYQPCFCVFDVLLLNDKILTKFPLEKRLSILQKVIKNPITGTIQVSQVNRGGASDIISFLNVSVDNNEEGLIVKDPKSVYKFNDRTSGWHKIKMEYFDDVVHDLDVLLMGGFYGSNRKITSVMVGIASGVNTFHSFGSISSGLNSEQIDILTERFQNEGIGFEKFSEKSKNHLFFGRETPDVYLEPEKSHLLQIRATELIRTTSDNVKCPYTMRFPRILKFREDKPVYDCLTMNELLELTGKNQAVIKLNKRHITMDEISSNKRTIKRAKIEMLSLVDSNGDFLKDKKIYVDSGTEKWSTEEIYHCIKKAGGDVCYRLEPTIDILLFSKFNKKIADLLKQSHKFDIVKVDWLQRVLKKKHVIGYRQDEVYSYGSNFWRGIPTTCDRFGDSFYDETTKQSLEKVFNRMTDCDYFLNTNSLTSFHKRLFENYTVYFDAFQELNNQLSSQIYYSFPDAKEFEYYGGKVSKLLDSDVNLIVIKEESSRKEIICTFLQLNNLSDINIVTRDFIQRSILEGSMEPQ